MIKNIVFDMGNVLMRYNPEVPLMQYFKTEADRDCIRKELFKGPEWIEGDLGYITNDAKYEQIKIRIAEDLHNDLRACIDGWQESMMPLEGAYEFVTYLKEKAYKVYVLSNASDEFYTYFKRFADFSLWDGMVVSSDIHVIKPDERIYKHLLEKYNLEATECLFIDDMAENIKAAKTLGFEAEHFLGDYEDIKRKYKL